MITKEGGFTPEKDLVLLRFNVTLIEDDIQKDVSRITEETFHFSRSEFKFDMTEDSIGGMFMTLMHVFFMQHLVEPKGEIQVDVKISPQGKTLMEFHGFDPRVTKSITDLSVVTYSEKSKMEKFFERYFPGQQVVAKAFGA